MSFLDSMSISASALSATRLRMDVIAENIANSTTTRTETGDPYRRRYVVYQERAMTDSEANFSSLFDKAQTVSAADLLARTDAQTVPAGTLASTLPLSSTETLTTAQANVRALYQQALAGQSGIQLADTQYVSAGGGVRVIEIGEDQSEFLLDYNPTHPDADEDGYVRLPNVDVVQEMTDMMSAYRAYEANITALNTFKDMAMKTLELGS